MRVVDQLPWAAGTAFEAYGVRLGVRVSEEPLLSRIQDYLPCGWRPIDEVSPLVQRLYSLYIDAVSGLPVIFDGTDEGAALANVEVALQVLESRMKCYIAAVAPSLIFVHAGTVAWKGHAILVPGATHTGKTTLTAALVRAGATYYSDEFAVLDRRGRVHPYPQKLGIRRGDRVEHDWVTVEELGGRAGIEPVRIGLVAVAPLGSASGWHPQPMSRIEGLRALLANTFTARRRPKTCMNVLERAIDGAHMVAGPRGDAGETARRLLAMADESGD
jgi:hypothetical protein